MPRTGRRKTRRTPRTLALRLLATAAMVAGVAGSGCASARLADFDAFAQAGTQYVTAVDALLVEAGGIAVDTSSEKLLASRDLAPVSRDAFAAQDAAVRSYLDQLRLIDRQVDLLGDYFTGLAELASSGAPDAAATQLEATATALTGLSQTLRGRIPAQDAAAISDVAGGVGKLMVQEAESAALDRELERRKQTIAEALLLQEALLAAVRAQVTADLQFTNGLTYEKTVVVPFLDPGAVTTDAQRQAWMAQRRSLLGQPSTVAQLDAAASAARTLRQAWAELLAHRLTPADLESVVAELQPIFAGLDALKSPPSQPSTPAPGSQP